MRPNHPGECVAPHSCRTSCVSPDGARNTRKKQNTSRCQFSDCSQHFPAMPERHAKSIKVMVR